VQKARTSSTPTKTGSAAFATRGRSGLRVRRSSLRTWRRSFANLAVLGDRHPLTLAPLTAQHERRVLRRQQDRGIPPALVRRAFEGEASVGGKLAGDLRAAVLEVVVVWEHNVNDAIVRGARRRARLRVPNAIGLRPSVSAVRTVRRRFTMACRLRLPRPRRSRRFRRAREIGDLILGRDAASVQEVRRPHAPGAPT